MPEEVEENGETLDHVSENEDESELVAKDDDRMVDNCIDGPPEAKKKYDPKDSQRPRRKKARRACYACQRAHLTCGDERPCKRCIKRGLADACQDGVRKKAKYLHDAPEEALGPVLGPNYNSGTERTRFNAQRQNSTASDLSNSVSNSVSNLGSAAAGFLGQSGAASFTVYPHGGRVIVAMTDGMTFNPQTSPVSPSFAGNAAAANAQPQVDSMLQSSPMDLNALFDPRNPALYNFDLEGLNFGSQYAGWEFGILNKMALGAETPPRDKAMSQTSSVDANYASLFGANGGGAAAYDTSGLLGGAGDLPGVDSGSAVYTQGNLQHGLPHAYAIAAGPMGLASPGTETTASPRAKLDGEPGLAAFTALPGASAGSGIKPKQDKAVQSVLGKRQRDSAAVYATVKEPYPYMAGFHNMISALKNRLPTDKLAIIARSLSEIRPSFIACTKDLTREDLVFMEKCFQRTLVEFDDFMQHCCAPTIVCHRSGEVADVNKEFTALTGWTKEVLLGKVANRNLHLRYASHAGSAPASDVDSLRPGGSTLEAAGGTSQPVFLAELLDDDSVVQFYRDFAQLAFEDSRGKVQRSCCLMKYRAQDDDVCGKDELTRKGARPGILSNRVTLIEKDGKVNCTYCWTIKRDVFDIPMMIIMNFLPRYHPNQEPHQLAV